MRCCLISTQDSASTFLFESLNKMKEVEWVRIDEKEYSRTTDCRYVFVFRWPHLIPNDLLLRQEVIGFHTSNLPQGRGGSPLQNQIIEGVTSTKINALQLTDELDAGPIYKSLHLTLQGSIQDVWMTLAKLAAGIIGEIIEKNLKPTPQSMEDVALYKRRRNNDITQACEGDISNLYRFIQMLDGDGYPRACVTIGEYIFEFSRAALREGGYEVISDVSIKRKK